MYTVVRFSHDHDEVLTTIAQELNQLVVGSYTGNDRVPHRFSCDIETQGSWHAHRKAIIAFIMKCDELLTRVVNNEATIQFDVAVEPEDYSNRNITELILDAELSLMLSKYKIVIVFSIYSGG